MVINDDDDDNESENHNKDEDGNDDDNMTTVVMLYQPFCTHQGHEDEVRPGLENPDEALEG